MSWASQKEILELFVEAASLGAGARARGARAFALFNLGDDTHVSGDTWTSLRINSALLPPRRRLRTKPPPVVAPTPAATTPAVVRPRHAAWEPVNAYGSRWCPGCKRFLHPDLFFGEPTERAAHVPRIECRGCRKKKQRSRSAARAQTQVV